MADEQAKEQKEAKKSAPKAAPKRFEVLHVAVHDGVGGKYEAGDIVTETAENAAAIAIWLEKKWAKPA